MLPSATSLCRAGCSCQSNLTLLALSSQGTDGEQIWLGIAEPKNFFGPFVRSIPHHHRQFRSSSSGSIRQRCPYWLLGECGHQVRINGTGFGGNLWPDNEPGEDPTIFQDKDENVHMLFHGCVYKIVIMILTSRCLVIVSCTGDGNEVIQ